MSNATLRRGNVVVFLEVFSMAKCKCGADIREGKTYCTWCDPSRSDAEKKELRSRGGLRSRKIPLPDWFDISNYLPLTPSSIKRYYGDLMRVAYELYQDDASRFFKAQKDITPRASEYAYLESIINAQDRIAALEDKRNGKLLPGKVEDDNAITGEFTQAD